MNQVLEANVRGGTGTRARLENQVAAGKTGTAQNFSDAWFVGWSDGLLTAVWTGNDDGSPTDHAVGGAGPARIFARFVTNAPAVGAPSTTMVGARAEPGPAEAGPDADASVSTPAAGNDAIGALLQRLGSGE